MAQLSPMRMIILPFLHERKLYINRIDRNHKYFYTVIEESNDKDITNQSATTTLFVAMDTTVSKYMVYSERAILLNTVDFSEQTR